MAEVELARSISIAVQSAYRRDDMEEKRRQMMTDWANFSYGEREAWPTVGLTE